MKSTFMDSIPWLKVTVTNLTWNGYSETLYKLKIPLILMNIVNITSKF